MLSEVRIQNSVVSTNHYTYNGENRLIMASNANTIVTYAYDYMGRRFSKIVTTNSVSTTNTFIYDGWNLIAEKSVQSATYADNYYVWGLDLSGSLQGAGGIGGLLSVVDNSYSPQPTAYFPNFDANGNITEYITTNGTVAAHYEYNPFGGISTSSGIKADDFNFRFSTKYFDKETGLYNYGMRYYSSELGRWLNRDPIWETGSVNVYAFVINQSTYFVDPYGRELWPKFKEWILPIILNLPKCPGIVSFCADPPSMGGPYLPPTPWSTPVCNPVLDDCGRCIAIMCTKTRRSARYSSEEGKLETSVYLIPCL